MLYCFILILAASFAANDDVISLDKAKDHVGKSVTVKVTIKSSNFLKDRDICFLNSKANHRDADNFTIVLKEKGLAAFKEKKIDDPATHFKDKTILVTGKVEEYRDKLQIVVEKFDQVKLQEADSDKEADKPGK